MAFAIPFGKVSVAGAAMGYMGQQMVSANTAAKKATKNLAEDNAAAIQSAKDAQATAASQAAESIKARKRAINRSQSIFTSPLGLSGQATVAKKMLLGQ